MFILVSLSLVRGVCLYSWHIMFICAAHVEELITQALERTEGALAALKKQFV